MSTECSTIVWKRDFGNATRKVIAARLADHADDEGRGIWPSVERVAAQCNTSPRTVQRTLAAFVEEGILKIVAEGGKGRRSTTHYDFVMGKLTALPLARWVPDAPNSKGDTVSPLENHGEIQGDSGDIKGDTDDGLGCHGVTQTVIEPPIEPSMEREGVREPEEGQTASTEPAESREAIERAFLRWWPTWPTYPSGSEAATRKAWFGLTRAERQACIERTADYIAKVGPRKKDYTFAHVYLAEKHWTRLADKAAAEAKPELVKPLGKAGMAMRFAELLKPMASVMPAAPLLVRQIIERGGEAAEREIAQRRERYGWPKVHEMNEKALAREGMVAPPDMVLLGADFVSVALDGPVGQAWRRLFQRMQLPWIRHPAETEYAYFPPLPAGETDLDKAVAAAFWAFKRKVEGDVHAAAE